MSFLQKLRVRASARRPPPPMIQCDLTGITKVWVVGESEQIAWDQITAAFVYKRDCLTTDQIRLVLGDQDLCKWLEVTEDEPGFNELITNLPNHLPGCQASEDWFTNVAVPAFETKWTQIFSRRDTDPQPEL